MKLVYIVTVLFVGAVRGDDGSSVVEPSGLDKLDDTLINTDLVMVFAIFRHGDRTPDEEELALYPSDQKISDKIFFPFGKKSLTNKGKQRAFYVGRYLRGLYDGFISRLYLANEITVRTTDYSRTKMTALAAMAGMFPPPPAQKWNPELNWQPVPYDTPPYDEDDILYWYNCPRYTLLRNQIYEEPKIQKLLEPYDGLFQFLSEKTGKNITTPENVFFLDNLFQTLKNVGVDPPKWAQDVMPKIKEMTKIEYAIEFNNLELTRLATGVLMEFILTKTRDVVRNTTKPVEPKMILISAHENNVAALMSAVRVFEPHQPNYGATFTLELRKHLLTGEYGITAVYAKDAGGPGEILPIKGCGNNIFCNYDKFVNLVEDVAWTEVEFWQECFKEK